jgi:hypothetical protein
MSRNPFGRRAFGLNCFFFFAMKCFHHAGPAAGWPNPEL